MGKAQVEVYFGAIKQIVRAEEGREKKLELFNLLKMTEGYRRNLDLFHIIRDLERKTRYPLFLKTPPGEGQVISDEVTSELLAGLGNSEAKALIFRSMPQDETCFSRDLFDLSKRIQGNNPGWVQGHAVAHQYGIKSYEPNGLVQRAENPQTGSTGFVKTVRGKNEGDDFASLFILFSLNHSVSLYSLIGPSQPKITGGEEGETVGEKRSYPMVIDLIKIYRVLAQWIREEQQLRKNDPQNSIFPKRQADLLAECDVTQARASIALRHLSMHDIIDYEFADQTKHYTGYKASPPLVEGQNLPHRLYNGLPADFLAVMRENANQYLTIDDIYEKLTEANSKYSVGSEREKTSLKNNLTHLAGFYKTEGFLEARDFDSRTRSTIELSDAQKETILEFTSLLDHFQTQSPRAIEYAREAFAALSTEQISALMKKAHDASQQVDRHSYEELKIYILSVLLTQPGSRVRQLQQILMDSFKNKISHGRTMSILREMRKGGFVTNTSTVPTTWTIKTPNGAKNSEAKAE